MNRSSRESTENSGISFFQEVFQYFVGSNGNKNRVHVDLTRNEICDSACRCGTWGRVGETWRTSICGSGTAATPCNALQRPATCHLRCVLVVLFYLSFQSGAIAMLPRFSTDSSVPLHLRAFAEKLLFSVAIIKPGDEAALRRTLPDNYDSA